MLTSSYHPLSVVLFLLVGTMKILPSFAFTSLISKSNTFAPTLIRKQATSLFSSSSSTPSVFYDTPETLPEFDSQEEYLKYLESVSALPKGFATGTAHGTFIPVESPELGNMDICGTIITLTDGPTDSWAACFTSNMVSNKALSILVRMLTVRGKKRN